MDYNDFFFFIFFFIALDIIINAPPSPKQLLPRLGQHALNGLLRIAVNNQQQEMMPSKSWVTMSLGCLFVCPAANHCNSFEVSPHKTEWSPTAVVVIIILIQDLSFNRVEKLGDCRPRMNASELICLEIEHLHCLLLATQMAAAAAAQNGIRSSLLQSGLAGYPTTSYARISYDSTSESCYNHNKKKRKYSKECAECHTRISPEWRKGPNGMGTYVQRGPECSKKKKHTHTREELENFDWLIFPPLLHRLCNACGLRWARANKRQKRTEEFQDIQWRGSIDRLLN